MKPKHKRTTVKKQNKTIRSYSISFLFEIKVLFIYF